MTKNIVRKSLSVMSASALAMAALVAAPAAHAAGELKLEAGAGTLFAVPHQTDITLKASITTGYSSAELAFLKFKVATAGGVNIRAAVNTTTASATANSSTAVLVDNTESSDVIALNAGSSVSGAIALYATDSAGSDIALNASSVSATVTAFIDKDGDNVVDSDEWQAVQTVTWVDSDALDVVLTMDQPVLGANRTLKAYIASTQINMAQSYDQFNVDFTGTNKAQSNVAPSYSSASGKTTVTGQTSGSIVAGTYSAALQLASTDIKTVSRTVSSTTVSTVVATAGAGADNEALGQNDSAKNIRSGSGSLVYKVVVKDSASAPISGKTVTLNVSETAINNIEAAATVSVGGSTLKNADATDTEDIDVTGVTDVNGTVKFTISWSGLGAVSAGDPFQVEASVDGVSGGTDTFTTVAAAATTLYNADIQASDEQVVVPVGSSFTLTYHLLDQFGQLFSKAGYSVTATAPNSVAATGVFSGGKATVTFAGYNSDNKGAKSISSAVTNTVGATTSGISSAGVTVYVGAPNAPATVQLAGTYGTSTSKTSLNVEATADADVRVGTSTDAPTAEITDATATVRDANGNGTRSQVTFSGANLIFKSATGIYKKGSITVWTDSSGVADVDISSQVAGAQTLTVTAGSATATKSIVFADAAATAGTKLTWTVPATVASGSTFKVVGTLTDDYGNPVKVTDTADISVSYDGPGLVSGSLPNTTDSKGQFSFWVLVGSNDSGTATITAKYDQSSDGDFTGVVATDMDIVSSVTVTLGVAAVPVAVDTGKVNAGSFNGYVAVFAKGYNGSRLSWKIAGKWFSTNVTKDYAVYQRKTVAVGMDVVVSLYIDGELELTKTVTTR